MLAAAGLAGWDLLAFEAQQAFETAGEAAPPAIAHRWSEVLQWHPSLSLFWPALGREARQKRDDWQVKAAGVQVANGTAPADLEARLGQLKDQAPRLTPAIRQVEAAQEKTRHDQRWKTVQAEALSLAALDDPATPLKTIDTFLREYPETPRRADALALARTLKDDLARRQTAVDRQFVDDLMRSESLPTVSLADQIERARQFLADHPASALREEVSRRLEIYLRRLDEHDIDEVARILAQESHSVFRPDRAIPELPEEPRSRRAVRERGDRSQGSNPPRVGCLRISSGVRPRPGASRRRRRDRPAAARLSSRSFRRPVRGRRPALPGMVG